MNLFEKTIASASEPVPVWLETAGFVGLAIILLLDILIIFKRPHVPSNREAVLWVGFYSLLAIAFGILLGVNTNATKAGEFFAGWLTEYSLSIDNLFVFIIIMSRLRVPAKHQQEVLMVGIIMSLVLRGGFIFLGAVIINSFSGIFYIFGAFLIYTAYHQVARGKEEDEESEIKIISWLRKRVRVSDDYDGAKLVTRVNGRKTLTPMLLVFLSIGATDLLFAFDSIPAIFGITQDAFIVFTANIFALMGLRQLYFLLGGLMNKLEHLKYGIGAILGFIGVKLVFHALHLNAIPFINGGKPLPWPWLEIPTTVSLGFIIGAILISAITSVIVAKKKD
jgi:tellurite resistance protein TerC